MSSHKIAIIGAGAVGSTIAYTLMLKNVTTEILLVDVDQANVEGQALDLSDTASVSSCKVRIASLMDAGQADIIIVTAGAKQKEGESRTNVSRIEQKFSDSGGV
jgi:L-lactate dehydrogenase